MESLCESAVLMLEILNALFCLIFPAITLMILLMMQPVILSFMMMILVSTQNKIGNNLSWPCAYQGVRNVSFFGTFCVRMTSDDSGTIGLINI